MVGLETWLPALLAFIAVALATVALALFVEIGITERRRRTYLKRLEQDAEGLHEELVPKSLIEARSAPVTRAEQLLARFPQIRESRLRLERAGLGWQVQTYYVVAAGLAVSFFLAALLASGTLLVAIPLGVLGAMGPNLYVRYKRRQKLRRFEEQFPEAIDLLGRAIRAGHPLTSGLKTVAEESPDPLASEFRQVFEEQRFGLPFEDALLALTDRNELVDSRIFVTAVLIQREVGGNLAEILDKIASTVRARFSILRQLRTYTAQGRLTGYVVAALPVVVGITIYFLDPSYVSMLWTEKLGRFMMGTAIVMQVIGYLWIRKIVNIEI
jgi:tight adherence protein B